MNVDGCRMSQCSNCWKTLHLPHVSIFRRSEYMLSGFLSSKQVSSCVVEVQQPRAATTTKLLCFSSLSLSDSGIQPRWRSDVSGAEQQDSQDTEPCGFGTRYCWPDPHNCLCGSCDKCRWQILI